MGPEVPCLKQSPRAAPLRADAFAGVRTRRMLAVCLDLVLVSMLVALFWTASIVLTLGLALFFLPPLWPIVAFFYNGLTVSGAKMATPGMRAMDLEMRLHEQRPAGSVHQCGGARGALLRELVLPAHLPGFAGRFGEAVPARHPRRGGGRAAPVEMPGGDRAGSGVLWVDGQREWRRRDPGSTRRSAVLPDRALALPIPARPAGTEDLHPSGRQARRLAERPPDPDRLPPLADDRLPARLRKLPRLRVGARAGRRLVQPNDSQRRAMRANADSSASSWPPKPTNEHFSLFRAYLDARHPEGGMADMSSLDFAMMVEDTHIETHLAEYRLRRAPDDTSRFGLALRGVPDRPARRRPVPRLFLLRAPPRPPLARSLRHPRPYREGPRASACRTSISAIGSRGRRRWATRPPTCRRSASACTAGRGSSGRGWRVRGANSSGRQGAMGLRQRRRGFQGWSEFSQ